MKPSDVSRPTQRERPTRRDRWIGGAVCAVLSGLLFAHFAATLLAVGPMNPVKLAHGASAHSYLDPYFAQTWNLFAPDPINDERGLMVRAELADASRTVTAWTDITNQNIERLYHNRLLPPRNSRLVSNGLAMVIATDPVADKLREHEKEKTPTGETKTGKAGEDRRTVSLEQLTEAERRYQERALSFMQSLASAEARQLWGPRIARVQLRLVVHEFPRYSQRERWREIGSIETFDLAWQDFRPPASRPRSDR
jgi:hypothetical protein